MAVAHAEEEAGASEAEDVQDAPRQDEPEQVPAGVGASGRVGCGEHDETAPVQLSGQGQRPRENEKLANVGRGVRSALGNSSALVCCVRHNVRAALEELSTGA